ncbi:MAG TPA: aldehyde dehydrogenase family protein [Anaerolineaceae bacterium]|nr:aldehyde dehydrogenase family protein [Anaerolineaceae bacterium]
MEEKILIENIDRLRATFLSGKTKPLAWRRSQLLALHRMLTERSLEFEAALKKDLHKSLFESYATETGFIQLEIDHTLAHLEHWMRPEKIHSPIFLQPATSHVIYEPLGVSLIMGAWNYPIQLTLGPLVAAIAAGNAAVIKPPRTAKAVFQALAQLLPQYLDADAFFVIGDDTPNDMILSQRFDKFFFTGSAEVGRIVMQAAIKNLTPVTLELGGKSPAIVDETANLRVTACRIAQGKFFNAGQTCVAPDYVLAHEAILDKLVAELTRAIIAFYGDDPQHSAEFARIINAKQFDKLVTYFKDGEVVFGGKSNREELYVAPTILKNVSADAAVMQNEIFGPILPILPFKTMDEALNFVQQREKPLAFYVFTEDARVAEHAIAQSTSGGVCINEAVNHLAVGGLPFGGVGNSGMGKYHGEWGFKEFSNARALLNHGTSFDPSLRYPPYTDEKINKMKKLMTMKLPEFLEGLLRFLLGNWGEAILKLIK